MRHVLVVGAGRLGRAVIEKLARASRGGPARRGCRGRRPGRKAAPIAGISVLGTTADVARIVDARGIDTVFLALPLEAHRTMLAVLKDVGRTVADVRVVPDLLQHITFRAGVEDLDGLPVVHLTQVPLTGWMSLVKRALDSRCRSARPDRSLARSLRSSRSRSGSKTGSRSSTGRRAWASTAGLSTS